jgi:L-ascorbate metabolism protein UlaG (beta-lactamase superfamily)
MQIKILNKENLEIKTKEATVVGGKIVKINNIELLGPGEYEIGGIEVFGLFDNIYIFHVEGMAVGYFAGLNRELTEKEIQSLSIVEIAILPVGGGEVLDSKKALDLAKLIDPKIIIPIQATDYKEFCEQAGNCQEPIDVFKITRQQLMLMEGRTVIQLKS